MKHLLLTASITLSASAIAQTNTYNNTASKILSTNESLSLRGYGELIYNQKMDASTMRNGKLDARRFILFTGYKFDEKTQFLSEIEVEHANEIYLEQAFIQHRISPRLNFRAGLMLIPMGLVNEYHEPTTFHGVERPNVDKYLIPSTWREMGVGFQGVMPELNLAYQAYLINGLKSHDGSQGLFDEVNGVRSGRQKAIKSTMSSPNVTAKVNFVGIPHLNLGLGLFAGKSQSQLFDGVGRLDAFAATQADSSTVGMTMVAMDARYHRKRFQARAQWVHSLFSGTEAYNAYTGKELGSLMTGSYVEMAYQVLPKSSRYTLYPFSRLEWYDTQAGEGNYFDNPSSNRFEWTTGLSFFLHDGVVLKADYQMMGSTQQINMGLGVWF